jgi:16S rRNA (cytosine1402-N4)-methyltransferase
MLDETLQALSIQPGGRYVDCTLGGGGHSAAILERSSPGGQLLGIEADPEALKIAAARLQPFGNSALLVNDNFVNLRDIAARYNFMPVHGILFDLGLSTIQLEGNRGFSFQSEAPLDMRVSPDQELTAADVVNTLSESELANIIWRYGEETDSRRIARMLVRARPIETTGELVRAIEKAVPGGRGKIHPATKTFQALRITVNHELENLSSALEQAVELLGYEGRLVVISYHSLEDRIVKQFMQREASSCICPPGLPKCVCGHQPTLRIINRRVITPSPEEIAANPRARSAKLRCAERIIIQDAPITESFRRPQRLKGDKNDKVAPPSRARGRSPVVEPSCLSAGPGPETTIKLRVAFSGFCLS